MIGDFEKATPGESGDFIHNFKVYFGKKKKKVIYKKKIIYFVKGDALK